MLPALAHCPDTDFEIEPIIRDGRVVDFNVVNPLPAILHELPETVVAGLITPREDR
jgi:hypothetical protein